VSADRWIITCDPGVDDAVALAVAAGRPDIVVTAVVAGAGNVDAPRAWRNAAGIAALAGLDAPVAEGSPTTVDGMVIRREGSSHGPDGLVGLAGRLPPPPGEGHPGWPVGTEHVVALGPLTDLALALRSGRRVERVVWLGGTAPARRSAGVGGGTATPEPEFNASVDPQAVDEVLAAVPEVVIVPVDVSRRVTLDAGQVARWRSGSPIALLCAELAERRRAAGGGTLHDPVAVVAAAEPDLFGWERHGVRCSSGGPHAPGVLVADEHPSGEASVAVDIDATAVADRIVTAVLACP
jgi:inosine-uridine nucleoside N-ribohydrolase